MKTTILLALSLFLPNLGGGNGSLGPSLILSPLLRVWDEGPPIFKTILMLGLLLPLSIRAEWGWGVWLAGSSLFLHP
jgi:hypothetical protein